MSGVTMEIKIDKEFADLIPPLCKEERHQLEQNIIAEGCRDPLVVWNGTLIDGHNRYEICTRNDIGYEVIERHFDSRTQVLLWMIDNQFGRRNLADIDRIALARKRESVLKPLAKENLKTSTGGISPQPLAKLPKAAIDTRKEAAKSAGVGERTYDAGKLILDAAEKGEIEPEVVEKVRRKETSIHRVAKDIKEKRQAAKRQEKRQAAAATIKPQEIQNVHVGDFRQHFDKVADGSLSLIFTDPPYDRKAIELFDGLGEFASKKLCEGGSLLAYVGHIQIPDAIESLSKNLRYWWVCCCLHSGGESLMKEYGIRVGWKAMLWFVKGTRDDKQNIVRDVVSGGREKSHHDWQQSQSEAEYWIENLCHPDGMVCDPFLGGGTTGAAAKKLNRKWVGFEVDPDQAAIAMQRIQGL
jgi:16S rRNA G966 N2-methylase RsmD